MLVHRLVIDLIEAGGNTETHSRNQTGNRNVIFILQQRAYFLIFFTHFFQ